jgi:hypothetical protein
VFNPSFSDAAIAADLVFGQGLLNAQFVDGVSVHDVLAAVIAHLWNPVDDNQGAVWQVVDNSQTGGWAPVNDVQAGGWVPVSDTQSGGWTPVNDSESSTWTDINPNEDNRYP